MKLTVRAAMTCLTALHAAAVEPVSMAFMDTSIRKKYTAGTRSRIWNRQENTKITHSLFAQVIYWKMQRIWRNGAITAG